MFAKGNLNASGVKLVNYILSAERDDERVEFGGARGFDFFSSDPREAARLMQRMADATTRCEKPWFHTQTRLPADERLTPEQWEVVRLREEKRLGFSDLPCIWSFHVNEATGERHMHAAWFRVDVEQERAVDPGLFKLRLKETCRSLEREFGLRELDNHRQPHDRARAADRNEVEEARRLGTDIRAIRNAILDCYEHADNGRAFKAAIEERGFILANGDRRDCYLVIDQAGDITHSTKNSAATPWRKRGPDLQTSTARSCRALSKRKRCRQSGAPSGHSKIRGSRKRMELAARGAYEILGEVGRHAEAEHEFANAGARVTEPPAPIFDRDAANRAADDRIVEAAIEREEATGGAQEGRQGPERHREAQDQPAARGRYVDLETPQPDDARQLGKTARNIHEAWQTSRTASELEDALAARGISLAEVSGEEARASQRIAAFAKESRQLRPHLQRRGDRRRQ